MSFADPAQNVSHFGFADNLTVADFGAGGGAYALALARRLRDGKVYAIEIQKELLEKLAAEGRAAQLNNLEVIWGDIEKLGGTKLADGSVDGVLISNVLFQTPAAYSIALEAKRILRPGGLVVVIDWSDSFGGLGPPAEAVVSAAKVEEIFTSAGFKLLGDFTAGPHHWGRRFRK